MILNKPYSRESFEDFLEFFLPEDFVLKLEDLNLDAKYKTIKSGKILGQCDSLGIKVIELEHEKEGDPRVLLAQEAFKILAENFTKKALVVFKGGSSQNWRLSFMTMQFEIKEGNKLSRTYSNPRRKSFFLGVDSRIATPNNFLVNKGKVKDIIDLESRFDVEIVTKEFFSKYKKLFDILLEHLKNDKAFNAFAGKHGLKLEIFAKKLLGQIVFLYFLQKKGWLGARKGEYISKGDSQFLRSLFEKCKDNKENFFNDYLEHLFYNCLNSLPQMAGSFYREKFDCQIPFLNGGLFEPVSGYNWEDEFLNIPNEIFSNEKGEGILDIFDLYNFTIDENTLDDQEVSVDPEMLGKVFENLLEENIRKGQGSFYTPRDIVHYMCHESLINYICANSNINKEKIKRLILREGIIDDCDLQDIENEEDLEKVAKGNLFLEKNEAKELNELLKNVKIIDPACGSGAFLVGMLHEIVQARSYLYIWYLGEPNNMEYTLKKETIQNCLYGVDVDLGAIDIAKLRFWLSVIVDENIDDVAPLPNLDYRVMQGNSLFDDLVIGGSVIKFDFDGKKRMDGRTKEQKELFKSGIQTKLILEESDILAEKLEKYHAEYFSITDPEKKRILKKKIDNIEDELIQSKCLEEIRNAELFVQNAIKDSKKILKGTEKILAVKNVLDKWKKDRLRPFFPWKLHFGEVFNRENSGFDIVIGNPPYVNANELKKSMDNDLYTKLKEFYITAKGTVDLYIYFMEKGIRLLSSNGTLAFITPNKYLSVSYGKALREYLFYNASLLIIADYSNVKVFEEASIYPVVSVYSKNKNEKNYNISVGKYFVNQEKMTFRNIDSSKLSMLNDFIWSFLLNDSIDIVQKIINQSVPLHESGKINATSTTSEADSYSNLVNNETGLKLINTGTIDKYVSLWGKKDLTNKGKKYAKPLLKIDNEVVNGRRSKMYKSPKIIFAKIAIETEAFYDEIGEYASINTNCIHSFEEKYDPKYILSWVNSKMFQFLFNCFFESLKMSKGYLLYSSPNLMNMYIKEIPKSEQEKFVTIANKILSLVREDDYCDNKIKQDSVHNYEKEIDKLFYDIFNLSAEEVMVIENS